MWRVYGRYNQEIQTNQVWFRKFTTEILCLKRPGRYLLLHDFNGFCIWITSIYSKLHLRIVKVYNLEEINILLKEFSWKHDTLTSLPLPLFQVRIAPEDWLPYSQRRTQFPSNLEIYVWRYSFFHQKIIAMVVCTFPCKLNKSCFWIVRNLYNIKQASGALCINRCMCMWIQWNSVIVLLSVYEIWERSVRVSCFTRYPHRNTS